MIKKYLIIIFLCRLTQKITTQMTVVIKRNKIIFLNNSGKKKYKNISNLIKILLIRYFIKMTYLV